MLCFIQAIDILLTKSISKFLKMTSIYIPRLSSVFTLETVYNIFISMGEVESVEFINAPINTSSGNVFGKFNSAIVNFTKIYPEHMMWGMMVIEGTYILEITPTEYWICLKYVSLGEITKLKTLIEQQSNTITKQSNTITKQSNTITELAFINKGTSYYDDSVPEFIVCPLNAELYEFYFDSDMTVA